MEKRAVKFIALASKTYVCVGEDESIKMSCKGVNKRVIASQDPYSIYERVLRTGEASGSTNSGFRVLKDKIFTYSCYRNAFPYFYIKRNCISTCGTYTEPYFNLTLNPIPKMYVCVYTDLPELSMDSEHLFEMDDLKFRTIRQAHCYKKLQSMFHDRRKPGQKRTMDCVAMFSIMKNILNTTDARSLHIIEKQLIPQDEFYTNEFDILYNILCLKISKNAQISQGLADVSGRLVVNTCKFNARLGSGVSPRESRWHPGSYLAGSNLYGHILMTAAVMLEKCIFPNGRQQQSERW